MRESKNGRWKQRGVVCPHCGARATIRRTVPISELTRELVFACDNHDCGCQWISTLSIDRLLVQSAMPKSGVAIPMSPRARSCNDAHVGAL